MSNVQIDWPEKVREIRSAGKTLEEIAREAGFRSLSTVSELSAGKRGRVTWEQGEALLRIHRRVTKSARRASRKHTRNVE